MEQEKLDKFYMAEERLREVCWELAMEKSIGWGPYVENLKKEKKELILKIKNYEIKK